MARGYDKTQSSFCIMHVLHAYLQTHYNSINVFFTLCACRLKGLSKPALALWCEQTAQAMLSVSGHSLSRIFYLTFLSDSPFSVKECAFIVEVQSDALGQLRCYLFVQGTL